MPELDFVPMPEHPSWSAFFAIDCLFIQRPNTAEGLGWIRQAQSMNVPVWLDIDDHLMAHPVDHPAFWNFHGEKQKILLEILQSVTVISASTQAIADWIASVAPQTRTVVIPNAVDETFLPAAPSRELDPKFLAWRGSPTHREDLEIARDLFTQDDITVHYWGSLPPWTRSGRDMISTWMHTDLFLHQLPLTPAGVMVVPLLDNALNRSKSNCSWLEATWAGLACAHLTKEGLRLPEFDKPGILIGIQLLEATPESLVMTRERSLACIKKNLTLVTVNILRATLLRSLV